MAEKSDIPYITCKKCGWSSAAFRASCPSCGSADLTQAQSSGAGQIVDFVPLFYPPENLKDLGQYVSVLVRFKEGFEMFAITLEKPEDLAIGAPVAVSNYDRESMRLFVGKA
jgi:uncharacterized OB-fold protein